MEIDPPDICLAESAVSALLQELNAYPKPGLVSEKDSGAHADMDYALMCQSARALFRPFACVAAAGREARPFEPFLLQLGLSAERVMLHATGGVNTHRGAIFTLGMLIAAAARAGALAAPLTPDGIRAVLIETWGGALQAHASSDTCGSSHGALVRRATGAGGARIEAAHGFPRIFETGIPVYRQALADGLDSNAARIQTLFALMEATEDSNVIFRGGSEAATFVRGSAADFLAAGGCHADGWFARGETLHRTFIERNISPGGCADLLAGTILIAGCYPARTSSASRPA